MVKIVKILVIDEEIGWRDLLAYELPQKGYKVVTAESGQDAIMKSKREPFDLIITDIKMPDMDGVDTFMALKNIQPNVPILLMTGQAMDERGQLGLQLGAFKRVRKPFD